MSAIVQNLLNLLPYIIFHMTHFVLYSLGHYVKFKDSASFIAQFLSFYFYYYYYIICKMSVWL